MDIQTLSDQFEIRNLISRYCRAMDDGDGDGYAATFTEDGILEGTTGSTQGHDALSGLPARFGGTLVHTAVNPILDLDGDRARHSCTVVVYNRPADGEPREVRMIVRYDDELVRTADGWRIARKRVVTDQT